MSTVQLKRGAAFRVTAVLRDPSGDGVNLTTGGITVTSQVRRESDHLVESLTVVPADQAVTPGGFTLSAADTSAWPIETLYWDVRFASASGTTISETAEIAMVREVTRP